MNTEAILREAQKLLADILAREVLCVDLTQRTAELEIKLRAVLA
jgi:hypothetical protein